MKIGLIINHFDPHGDSLQQAVARIADDLGDRGHAVTILTAVRDPYRKVRDYEVSAMVASPRISAWRLARFAGWVRKRLANDFDAGVSFTTAAPAPVLEPLAGTVRESMRRDQTGGWRGAIDALRPRRKVWLRRERQVLADPRVRSIVAVSRYLEQQLRDDRVELLPPPVTATPLGDSKQDEARRRIRRAFDIDDACPVFAFASSLPRQNGLSQVLRAAKLMMDRDAPFALLLAGPVGYAAQREAADLGIRGRVRFVGPTARLTDLYSAADVLAHPSFFEPAGLEVIHALLHGLPAITTRYNGAADVIAEQGAPQRGRVIDQPGDVIALADAMMQLAEYDTRQACRTACAGLADRISTTRHVDRLEQILVEAASNR